jgi:hypothetical protein
LANFFTEAAFACLRQIMMRRGKGQHDRPALLPTRERDDLRAQLDLVSRRH